MTRRWGSDARVQAAESHLALVDIDVPQSGAHPGGTEALVSDASSAPEAPVAPPAPPVPPAPIASSGSIDEPTLDDFPVGCLPGRLLAGKYRVERVLGRGGVGMVVAATHINLDQRVAIKFLLPQALANEEVVERFAREARAAAKIQNDHVVRVHDVGRLEDGSPYMVMECLTGTDLAAIIETRAPLPVEEAVEYMLQVCEALTEAHALGIVHRDLKPANIFVTRTGVGTACVKVVDFGISKSMLSERPITDEMAVMGSPGFMSPEQLWSTRDVDARTDIWAIGAILYELLTGRRAFYVENVAHLFEVVSTKTPAAMQDVRPDVPPKLEAIVRRCMAPVRERRFPSAVELADALAEFGPRRRAPRRSGAAIAARRRPSVRPWVALPVAGLVGAGLAVLIPSVAEENPSGVMAAGREAIGASQAPERVDTVPDVTSGVQQLDHSADPQEGSPRSAMTAATYVDNPSTTAPPRSRTRIRTPASGRGAGDPDEIEFGGRK